VPEVLKPIRSLWNEVIGFVFLSLAALAIPRTYKLWRDYEGSGDDFFRLVLSAGFIVVMASFGIQSFLRARKISRS